MSADIPTIVRYRMARSKEALDDARFLAEGRRTTACVNRIYYACFYAVSALLLTHGFSSSTHTGVRTLFGQHFIKTHLIAYDFGELYSELFQVRHRNDYIDLTEIPPSNITPWLTQAMRLIETIDALIQRSLPNESV